MSTYETLGGEDFVPRAVEEFYARLKSDPIVGEFFEHADLAKLTSHQKMFLTAALGGPDAYGGRDMRAAHAHLKITDTDFDLFLDYLGSTLGEMGATKTRIAEVVEALAPLRLEIVTAPSEGSDEWGALDPAGGSG
jgi:hemoglobin